MMDWLSNQNAKELIGLAAVVGGMLIAMVAIVSGQWARVRRDELRARQAEVDAALKQQMIERGMSADEIVQVLKAGQTKEKKSDPGSVPAK
jgi:hypothetical protein